MKDDKHFSWDLPIKDKMQVGRSAGRESRLESFQVKSNRHAIQKH